MYVAVKGGEQAIKSAHQLLAEYRRGDAAVAEISVAQIKQQMPLALARVMTEGSLYDEELAALAVKQAAGDITEAIFLLRAYRTTLPRVGGAEPLNTREMLLSRRISAIYKDLPGGQLLGPTFDYTHRLLDFALLAEGETDANKRPVNLDNKQTAACPHVMNILEQEGLMAPSECNNAKHSDITREAVQFPTGRSERLQILARGDEGYLLSLAYSTQRGYGRNHPFVGEIRIGEVEVAFTPTELGFEIVLGAIEVSECEMVTQFVEETGADEVVFTRGYGLAFGQAERKTMAMALMDRALCADEYGEEITSPAQQQEFVLAHCDNVEAAGFVSHLKLPHYVDFQSELELIRKIRRDQAGASQAEEDANEVEPA